jgi:Helicase associated domain
MGHCNIQDPSATSTAHKYRGLYAFVERLRLYRKLWTEMQKIRQPNEESQSLQHLSSLLTSQRMEQLNALGFLWTTTNDADNDPKRFCPTNDEHLFNAMLTEMKRVTKEGNAPLNKYPKLQEWVRKMRNEYKAMKDKKPTTLTPDRLAKLVEAGVTFEVPGKKSWDQRAVEWLEYKTKNGGKDPKRYDKSGLGKWVYNQRAKYRENREGGKTNLTEEQIR